MGYKNIICGIYSIHSLIDSKYYIGKAVNIGERLNNHKFQLRNNTHENTHLQNAYNKYGESNFKFEILLECEEQYLCSEENYWCNLLNVHNEKYGYNLQPTSPLCINRLSSESIVKRTLTRKINSNKRGYWVPDSYRQRLREEKIGKPVHPNMLKNSVLKTRKSVIKMDLDSNIIEEYISIMDAAKKNNLFSQNISKVCYGKYKTTGGFKWKFK